MGEKVVEKTLSKVRKQEQKFKKIKELKAKVNHTLSEVKAGEEFNHVSVISKKKSKMSLEDRLEADQDDITNIVKTETGHVMTFEPEKSRQSVRKEQEEREHREERRQVRRSAKSLKKDKLPPTFWMGKRVG